MINAIGSLLPQFNIRYFNQSDYPQLYSFMKNNSDYFRCVSGHPAAYDEVVSGISEMPPAVLPNQKHYIGIWEGDILIAVIDFIEKYPSPEYIYIGLFIINNSLHKKGIGKSIFEALKISAQKCGFSKLRLGCVTDNISGMSFWHSLKFCEVKLCDGDLLGTIQKKISVMDLTLNAIV